MEQKKQQYGSNSNTTMVLCIHSYSVSQEQCNVKQRGRQRATEKERKSSPLFFTINTDIISLLLCMMFECELGDLLETCNVGKLRRKYNTEMPLKRAHCTRRDTQAHNAYVPMIVNVFVRSSATVTRRFIHFLGRILGLSMLAAFSSSSQMCFI